MYAIRFTLAWLLLVVAIFTFGIMALVNASSFWASLFLTVVVAVLFFSICKAVSSRGSSTAFWVSFALCGWGYLHLVFSTSLAPFITDSLLTTRSLAWVHSHILTQPSLVVGANVSVEWNQGWFPATILEVKGDQYKIHYTGDSANWDEWVGPGRMRPEQPTWEAFQQVGQAIWAIIVAFVAGWTARWCFDREH